jgi:Flp pilus assembly secretin CpaC
LRYCKIPLRPTAAHFVALILVAFGANCVHAIPGPASAKDDDDVIRFKTSVGIDLKASRSRLFRIKNYIVRSYIHDPEIVEPVVLNAHEFILLGKAPGTTNLVIRDDSGQAVGIALRVVKEDNLSNQKQKHLMAIDAIELEELPAPSLIRLSAAQSKTFELKNHVVRTSISNPKIADVDLLSENAVALRGKAAGNATVFIWGGEGNIEGIELQVEQGSNQNNKAPGLSKLEQKTAARDAVLEEPLVECWMGSYKEMRKAPLSVPGGDHDKLEQFLRNQAPSYKGYDARQ